MEHKIRAALLAAALGVTVSGCGGMAGDSEATQPLADTSSVISPRLVPAPGSSTPPTSASATPDDVTNATDPPQATTPAPELQTLPTPVPVPAPTIEPASSITTDPVRELTSDLEALVQHCDTWGSEIDGNGNLFPCLQGPEIMKIQQALKAWDTGLVMEADGYFGVDTQRALLIWQMQRGWPGPTVEIDKMMNLGASVLSIVGNPDVSHEAACPIWHPVEIEGEDTHPENYRPLLRLCDSGQSVSNIQSLLSQEGFAVDVDGLYGLSTAQALADLERANFGSETTGDALYVDMFWFIAGD